MRIFAGVAGAHGKHLKIKNCVKFWNSHHRSSVAPLGNGRGRCEASGRGFPSDKGKCERSEAGGVREANGVINVIPEFVFISVPVIRRCFGMDKTLFWYG